MELSVTQENLSKALNIVSRIANLKTQLPILDNILLRTDGNRLLVASTNLEIATTEHVGAKIIKPGDITIPAKVVTEFVNNLPSGVINLKVEANHLLISAGKFTSTINGVIAEEFPDLPTIDEKEALKYVISVDDFKQAVGQVLISVSSDIARPVLTGVLWQVTDGNLYLVSTDGYRLSERRLMPASSEMSAIVPAQTLQEVIRAISDSDDEVETLFSDTQVRFRVGDTEVISQLIDGNFPDYQKLLPKDNDIKVNIKKANFMQVTKIAGLFAIHSSSGITVTADDENQLLSLKSIASEIGENTSEAEAKVSGSGKITLNARYLIDALNVVGSDNVSFEFKGKLAPCLIKTGAKSKQADFIHIIMPLKS